MNTGNIGARLRHAREARGLTIDGLSRSTRVQPRILSAIEQNDGVSLPPRPYGRGFVRAYASEVGLDPDATVREFFSQFAPPEAMAEGDPGAPPATPARRHWGWPVGAVLTYAAVGALVIVIGRWAILQTRGEPGAVGTAGTTATAPAPAASIDRRPADPPAPVHGVTIVLQAARPAWITAYADGRRVVYRALTPGETVTLRGTRDVSIRTGDAGALTWAVNGRTAELMGRPGEVRTVRVTPDAVRTVE